MRFFSGHTLGVFLMVVVALLWSSAGICTKMLSPELLEHNQWEVVFWRSFFSSITVFASFALLFGKNPFVEWVKTGYIGLLSTLFWMVLQTCFMLALTLTTSANVYLICSINPMLAAIFAWLILKTKLPRRTIVAVIATVIGVACVAAGGAGAGELSTPSQWLGVFLALFVTSTSAMNFVFMQGWGKGKNFIPCSAMGGAFSALIAFFAADPFVGTPFDIAVLAYLGVFQVGIASVLLIISSRYLIAPEIGLISRIETVAGPLWPWIFIGEAPNNPSIAGGAIILIALVGHEIAGARKQIANFIRFRARR